MRNAGDKMPASITQHLDGGCMTAQNGALSLLVKICSVAVFCAISPGLHAQWLNHKIPGLPRTPDGKVNLAAATPRTADGKPDLSGTWHTDAGYFQNLA